MCLPSAAFCLLAADNLATHEYTDDIPLLRSQRCGRAAECAGGNWYNCASWYRNLGLSVLVSESSGRGGGDRTHIPPPYLLVAGGGLGDDHVRVFNGLYPTDVAGAVLVGATDPDEEAHELKYMKGALSSFSPLARRAACKVVFPAMVHLGVMRLLGYPGSNRAIVFGSVDEANRRELDFLSIGRSADGEACYHDENNDEVRVAGNFGSRPFMILESSEPDRAPSPEYEKEIEALNDYRFHQLLPRLAALSTHGRLVLVENPMAPETIIAAVRDVITEVREERKE